MLLSYWGTCLCNWKAVPVQPNGSLVSEQTVLPVGLLKTPCLKTSCFLVCTQLSEALHPVNICSLSPPYFIPGILCNGFSWVPWVQWICKLISCTADPLCSWGTFTFFTVCFSVRAQKSIFWTKWSNYRYIFKTVIQLLKSHRDHQHTYNFMGFQRTALDLLQGYILLKIAWARWLTLLNLKSTQLQNKLCVFCFFLSCQGVLMYGNSDLC